MRTFDPKRHSQFPYCGELFRSGDDTAPARSPEVLSKIERIMNAK